MNRDKYKYIISSLINQELPSPTQLYTSKYVITDLKSEKFELTFSKSFDSKIGGLSVNQSYNGNNLTLTIDCRKPNKKEFDLMNNLEKVIFEFLDKQEVRYD